MLVWAHMQAFSFQRSWGHGLYRCSDDPGQNCGVGAKSSHCKDFIWCKMDTTLFKSILTYTSSVLKITKIGILILLVRDHMGESGGCLRCGWWSGSGLCATGATCCDVHYRGVPWGVCEEEPGALAQEERRLGKFSFCMIYFYSDWKCMYYVQERYSTFEYKNVFFIISLLFPITNYWWIFFPITNQWSINFPITYHQSPLFPITDHHDSQ